MVKFLASIPLLAAVWVVAAWFLMLTIGVTHGEWLPSLPTLSYTTALQLAGLLIGYRVAAAVLTVFIKDLGK